MRLERFLEKINSLQVLKIGMIWMMVKGNGISVEMIVA